MRKTTWVCDVCGLHKRSEEKSAPEGWLRLGITALTNTHRVFFGFADESIDVCSEECAAAGLPQLLERVKEVV